MKQHNGLLTLSLLFCSSITLAETPHSTSAVTTAADTRTLTGTILKDPNMELLDGLLRAKPIIMLRINKALDSIKGVTADLGDADKKESFKVQPHATTEQKQLIRNKESAFVQEKLAKALLPIKEFFSAILEHSGMVLPLVEESIVRNNPVNTSLLKQLFKSNGTLEAFLAKEITTASSLRSLCQEITKLFNDINASLSEPTKKAYEVYVKRMLEVLHAKKSAPTGKKPQHSAAAGA